MTQSVSQCVQRRPGCDRYHNLAVTQTCLDAVHGRPQMLRLRGEDNDLCPINCRKVIELGRHSIRIDEQDPSLFYGFTDANIIWRRNSRVEDASEYRFRHHPAAYERDLHNLLPDPPRATESSSPRDRRSNRPTRRVREVYSYCNPIARWAGSVSVGATSFSRVFLRAAMLTRLPVLIGASPR